MANKITWDDKVAINPRKVRINQVQDRDMNEIKNMHNLDTDRIDALVTSGALTYQTLALLTAVSPVPAEGTPAKVANDPTASNNGFYSVSGGAWVKDADLSTPALVTGLTGLDINIAEFVMHINEADVTFAEETITLPASETRYIGFDLLDYSIHYLKRNISDGIIWVGKVTTDATDVIDIEQITPKLPINKIPKSTYVLNESTRPLKVALIGDSTYGTTGGTYSFAEYLFDVARAADGLNVPNVGSSEYVNYGSGGQTSHYGFLYTAKGVRSGSGSDYNNTGLTYDAGAQGDIFTPTNLNILRNSPILTENYDVVLIGFGANGGESALGYLENIVKFFRENGIEVIITTTHNRTDNDTFLYDDGLIMKNIADNFGCAISDTWSFVKELEDEGVTTHSDVIHLNDDGKKGEARAIRSIINDIDLSANSISPSLTRFIKEPSQSTLARNFPNIAEYDGYPKSNTGSIISSSAPDTLNPNVHYKGVDSSVSLYELTVGETLKFSHAYASALDVVIDGSTQGEFDITIQGGGTVKTSVAHNSNTGNKAEVVEGILISSYVNIANNNLISNVPIQITCTSGTVKIYGILWHTFKNETIPFDSLKLVGTWGEEAEDGSHPLSKYTDTLNDYFTFDYYGSGCTVQLNSESAAGIVDIYVNGEIYIADEDLYSTGTYYKTLYITHATSDFFDVAPTKNRVTVIYKGLNGSAITPVATNRRLGIIQVKQFNRE